MQRTSALETTRLQLTLRRAAWPVLFAALMAIAGQVRIPVAGSPVPITLQVVIVLIAGATLAPLQAASAMLLFATVGALGAPVFQGGGAGPLHLLGPTGGYIAGFVAGAWVCARLVAGQRDSIARVAIAMAAAVLTIHSLGMTQLAVWYGGDFPLALRQGVLFFLPLDVVKIAVAAPMVAGGAILFGGRGGSGASPRGDDPR